MASDVFLQIACQLTLLVQIACIVYFDRFYLVFSRFQHCVPYNGYNCVMDIDCFPCQGAICFEGICQGGVATEPADALK